MVKMTMDQFRSYKAQMSGSASNTNTSAVPSQQAKEIKGVLKPNEVVKPNIVPQTNTKHENLPMVESSQAVTLSTPTIVRNVMKDIQPAQAPKAPEKQKPVVSAPQPISKEDFSSLLESQGDSVHASVHNSVSDQNEIMAKQIVEKLPFSISKDMEGRLYSLVLSRVKDVRKNDQVKEYALLSAVSGGLGLKPAEADMLVSVLQNVLEKPKTMPVVKPTISPSSEKIVKKPDGKKILSSLIAEDQVQAQMRVQVEKRSGGSKVLMHDVMVPSPLIQSVGPVDEILKATVVEFRRLGKDAVECADRFMNKFQTLKNDSYLLFLQGRAAWFKSPLYQSYLGILEMSLKTNKPLTSVIQQSGDQAFKLEEVEQIARISQSLYF